MFKVIIFVLLLTKIVTSRSVRNMHFYNNSDLESVLYNFVDHNGKPKTLGNESYYKTDTKKNDEDLPKSVSIFQLEDRLSKTKCLEYISQLKKIKSTARVAGGRNAKAGEFPHMGLLGYGNDKFKCGSFLISDEFLVTAKHCVKAAPKFVRLGVERMKQGGRAPKNVKIIDIITHPKLDVALLKMKRKIKFNNFVRPACIGGIPVHSAIVSGWGVANRVVTSINMSENLKTAVLDIIPYEECKEKYAIKSKTLSEDYICAHKPNGVADACRGDSGGPLQVKLNTNTKVPIYNVIGVTSGGSNCASYFPSRYVNITKVIDWIEDIVWKNGIEKYSPIKKVKVDPNMKKSLLTSKELQNQRDDPTLMKFQKCFEVCEKTYTSTHRICRRKCQKKCNMSKCQKRRQCKGRHVVKIETYAP